MSSFSNLARRSNPLLQRSQTRCPIQLAHAGHRARFFSDESQSSLSGKGKEKEKAQGAADENGAGKTAQRSPHAQWYSDTLPAMIPVALLGSAVYIGLKLLQTKLATEKHLEEANARIRQLEEEVGTLLLEQERQDSASMPNAPRDGHGLDAKPTPSRWWWFT
ncbi:hypothetical protein M0805_002937 [Coniferiporia weirii]|nr:hypothetical protein M0805_002937 [Coniferiporia weirii]